MIDESANRTEFVGVRLTSAERTALEGVAAKAELSLSEWLRQAVFAQVQDELADYLGIGRAQEAPRSPFA